MVSFVTSTVVLLIGAIFHGGNALPISVRQTGAWSACSGISGVCIDATTYTCTGDTQTGRCPGSSSILCCPSPFGVNAGSCATSAIGACTRTENCPRQVQTGLCPGPSGITCCPHSVATTAPPPTSTGLFLPDAPDTSGSLDSCTTEYIGLTGSCIDRSECTGGTFNGLCPGGSNILCCVPETRPTNSVPPTPFITLSQFSQLFTNVSPTRAAALYPYFLSSLSIASINSCLRVAAFVAQVGHESAGLLYFEELADGSAYEGRIDLGNTQPGDGRRFKGRGPIQLTGRTNYRAAGTALGRLFESRPEEVGMPSGGFQAAAWYWMTRVGNSDADAGTQAGLDRTTIAINGCGGAISGCNGVEDRRQRWVQARALLGC